MTDKWTLAILIVIARILLTAHSGRMSHSAIEATEALLDKANRAAI